MANEPVKNSSVESENIAKTESASNGYGASARPSLGARFKNHCRRFWWLHLLIFAVVVLVITLPLVFVGIPHIAQKEINKSTLEVTRQDVTDPQSNSVHLSLTNIAQSNSSYHPDLDGFRAALYLESTEPDIKPFGYINIPPSKATAETKIIVDQKLDVADMDQFKAYNRLVLVNETFRVGLRGRTGLKLSGLRKLNVDYNKIITMKGLNGLKGLNVTDLSIQLKPESDGTNLVGTVYIPNPSVMTLEMGNVTMNLAVDGQAIGNTTIANLTLRPGNNTVPMRSVTNQATVLQLVTTKYKNGIIPLQITGNSSVNSNGDHLAYYESAIQSNTVTIQLNVGPALASLGVNLTSSSP